jgi:hypothetical protein
MIEPTHSPMRTGRDGPPKRRRLRKRTHPLPPPWSVLNATGLSKVLGVSVGTVGRWRLLGCPTLGGPQRRIRSKFLLSAVLAWLSSSSRPDAPGSSSELHTGRDR